MLIIGVKRPRCIGNAGDYDYEAAEAVFARIYCRLHQGTGRKCQKDRSYTRACRGQRRDQIWAIQILDYF